jgi:hypothetical protein
MLIAIAAKHNLELK